MCFIFCLEAIFCNSGMDVNTVDMDRMDFVLFIIKYYSIYLTSKLK